MHYLDEGPADGPVVLLMHGEPSWCFLYRTMIPVLVDAGLRCIAPDLVGFGRSDKPAERSDYTYARHVEWARSLLLDVLALQDVTFFGQDWGGLVGLRVVAENPDRFARVAIGNTGLPTGDVDMPAVWHKFRLAVQNAESLDIGRFVASGCVRGLTDEVRAGYDAPFPDETYKAGPRAMPGLVPYRPDDPASGANRAAWHRLAASTTPMLVAFSDSDPITGAMGPILQRAMVGAAGRSSHSPTNSIPLAKNSAGTSVAGTMRWAKRPWIATSSSDTTEVPTSIAGRAVTGSEVRKSVSRSALPATNWPVTVAAQRRAIASRRPSWVTCQPSITR